MRFAISLGSKSSITSGPVSRILVSRSSLNTIPVSVFGYLGSSTRVLRRPGLGIQDLSQLVPIKSFIIQGREGKSSVLQIPQRKSSFNTRQVNDLNYSVTWNLVKNSSILQVPVSKPSMI